MTHLGLALVAIGLLTSFGSFVYAAYNMYCGVSSVTSAKPGVWHKLPSDNLDQRFKDHFKAIVGVAAGGFLTAVGGVILLVNCLGK